MIGIGLILAGCAKQDDTQPSEEKTPPNQEQQKPQEEPEEKEYAYHYPLSGEGTDEEINERAIAVMINNDIHARPQTGLTEADIVYEFLTEGNITRFLAIYQSEFPEEAGPVRSARDYFMEIAKGYNALYVAHGFSTEAKVMSDNNFVDNINGMYYDGTLFYRSSDRQAPHNSYIPFENIKEGADQKGYDLTILPPTLSFMTELEEKTVIGESAEEFTVSYSSSLYDVTFVYDKETEKYKRFTNGEQTLDYKTEEPVLVDNIVVIETAHQVTANNKGRRDIDINSGGKAFLIQKGKWREVEWKNVDGLVIPYENGKPVNLVQGMTWINVVPTSPGLSQSVLYKSVSPS